MAPLHSDLHSPPGTSYSINARQWNQLPHVLYEDATLCRQIQGLWLPKSGRVIRVAGKPVRRKSDLTYLGLHRGPRSKGCHFAEGKGMPHVACRVFQKPLKPQPPLQSRRHGRRRQPCSWLQERFGRRAQSQQTGPLRTQPGLLDPLWQLVTLHPPTARWDDRLLAAQGSVATHQEKMTRCAPSVTRSVTLCPSAQVKLVETHGSRYRLPLDTLLLRQVLHRLRALLIQC